MIRSIEMHMGPLEGGNVLPYLLWQMDTLSCRLGLSSFKVASVPDGNGIDHQREGRGAVQLRFIPSIMKATLSAEGKVAFL